MIQKAYTYEVTNSSQFYYVYIDKTLLGCIEKKSVWNEALSIEIKNHRYALGVDSNDDKALSIFNVTTKKNIGKIILSGYGPFAKAIFEYNGTRLHWVNKSFFAIHWQWLKSDAVVIENIENFEFNKQDGIIVLSDCFTDADLLIMIGVYLRNNIRLLPFKRLFSYGQKNAKGKGIIQ